MKREHLLFIIPCIIIVLAIIYFYLDKKTIVEVEGFDVKDKQILTTPTDFTTPTVSSLQPRPISGSGGRVAIGYYRYDETQEMRLPDDYTTVTLPPISKYMKDIPVGYYIAKIGDNPYVAKLPDKYNRVTIKPFNFVSNQGQYITLSSAGNFVVSGENPKDLPADEIVTDGYYRLNDTKQFVLPGNSLTLTPAPIQKYKLDLPSGYIIAIWGGTEYVTKSSNGISIPAGYYVSNYSNQEVLAKLPDYSVILTLLPIVNISLGYVFPEGYYIAKKDNNNVFAKLPDKVELFTLSPITGSETTVLLPRGYYIARYSKVEIQGGEATDIVLYMAKLPYGYTIPFENTSPDQYGRYTVKDETTTISVGTKQITITYNAYRPKPNTYATKQSELKSLSIDEGDYFGKIIVDNVYEKDYLKTNYNANVNNFPTYHETPEDIIKSISDSAKAGSTPSFASMTVVGPDGKMVEIPYVNGQALPTYYQPGSYTYGTTYVPNYEDSVYLSKSTGLSTLGKMYPTATIMGGFCNSKMSAEELEKKCNAIPNDQCASVSCCVLLGGSKCVYGNELGPKLKANYTDTFIKNRDVYYYQGKCYGNCV